MAVFDSVESGVETLARRPAEERFVLGSRRAHNTVRGALSMGMQAQMIAVLASMPVQMVESRVP